MSKKLSREQLLNLAVQHERSPKPSATTPKVPTLALDYGEKYCGLAIAPDGVTVLPAAVVQTEKIDSALESLIIDYKVEILVLGLPLSSDGSENHICQQIQTFSSQLRNRYKTLQIELVNERYSTQAVIAGENSRVDDLAAMQILEFYLAQTKK